MRLPYLNELEKTRNMIDVFKGYNHNLRIGDGEFYDMKNLTSDNYPVLSTRQPRGVFKTENGNINGVLGKDAVWYVESGSGYSYIVCNGFKIPLELSNSGTKTLIPFGAYIIIMPDKKYINTTNFDDCGKIDENFTAFLSLSGKKAIAFKNSKNQYIYTNDFWVEGGKSTTPKDGDIRVSNNILEEYSSSANSWVNLNPVCRIMVETIGKSFAKGDGVVVSVNGSALGSVDISDIGDNFIESTTVNSNFYTANDISTLSVTRYMPEMDFVCEAGNRLWGCRYGYNENGEFINEIYASKLGDFKNWKSFKGISTDSYIASVGTDGVFTGCINYLGNPIFFKENYMHKVYGDYPSNYQITTLPCRGVEIGSHKSLSIVNELLFYKTREGICVYDGSAPQDISYSFGGVQYSNGVGCGLNGKYYVALKLNTSKVEDRHFKISNTLFVAQNPCNLTKIEEATNDNEAIYEIGLTNTDKTETETGNYALFVYDTQRGLWHKESCGEIISMSVYKGNIYFVEKDSKELRTIFKTEDLGEEEVPWYAETGIINMQTPDKKYISTLNASMSLPYTASVAISIQYNSNGVWEQIYRSYGTKLRTVSIPIKPKRCDHFRLRFEGKGDAKLYSIVKTIERGSDV